MGQRLKCERCSRWGIDRLSEKANGTKQNGHKSARNIKENTMLKEKILTLWDKLCIFFHIFRRIYKHLFASLCMSSSNAHFTMYEVLIDGDKRIPGIAVTFLLIFEHSYLSLSTASYITPVWNGRIRTI